ncbi:MAG: hypothetical protein WCO98_09765 [bacterium]
MNNKEFKEKLADTREVFAVFGKPEPALKTVDELLAIEPDNIDALNLKAAILYEMDHDEASIAVSEKILELCPDNIEALHAMLAAENDQHNYAKALKWFKKAEKAIATDKSTEFVENEDYRQSLIAQVYCEKAYSLWYTDKTSEAIKVLTETGPAAAPLEIETFEDELDWLKNNPDPE